MITQLLLILIFLSAIGTGVTYLKININGKKKIINPKQLKLISNILLLVSVIFYLIIA